MTRDWFGPSPSWFPRLTKAPEIPETPPPACVSAVGPEGDQEDVVYFYTIPWVHDMSDEHFKLHVRLRHLTMMRSRMAMYSRIRHEQIHANCPQSWFDHVHAIPKESELCLSAR